jgi:hypothetical protein
MARAMILLVSGQPMPNLLAALEPALDIKLAHLIVSGEMEVAGVAERLAGVLEARHLSVVTHLVSDVFQPEVTRSMVASIIKGDPERFVLNLTGGTKPMVLGAYRAALEHGARDLLYLDPDQGLLRWLDGNRPPQKGLARLRIAEILRAHGYRPRSPVTPSRTAVQLAESLYRQLEGEALTAWNRLFGEVDRVCGRDRLWTPKNVWLSGVFRDREEEAIRLLDRPMREAEAMGFCAWGRSAQGGGWVRVDRQEDQKLLHGGWFELVVYRALQKLAPSRGLDELGLNMIVDAPDGGSNEFDCVARRANRLFFFEVKTAAMTGANGAGRPRDVLYKLGALKGAGGLTARACLVSRVAVSGGPARRFGGAGLGLVHGGETDPARLTEALAGWIASG